MLRTNALSILCIYLLSLSVVYAMSDDKYQPMHLKADFVDINQKDHKGLYMHNVEIDQGFSHLRAERATTKTDDKNSIIFAAACGTLGEPAHFWTRMSTDKPELHAFATKIHYYPGKHYIELVGEARVIQGKNAFYADYICYDVEKQRVRSQKTSNKRTTIIIYPESKHD